MRAKSFLPAHVWGRQRRDAQGHPPGQLCRGEVKTISLHPSCGEGVGGKASRKRRQDRWRVGGEAELAQLPLGTLVPCLCPAAGVLWLWQGGPELPSLKHLCLLRDVTGPQRS